MSSTKILTILPETSDSISLNNFIASITHKTSPLPILLPTSTKTALSGEGFLQKVPIIGDLIVMYFYSSATGAAGGAAAAAAGATA